MSESTTKRKAIGKKVRFEVFKRDGFQCQYCGAHPPQVILHVDHIDPVARGGKNSTDNLITSCLPCNLGKGATPLTSIPQNLADKAADIAEREEQIRGYQDIMAARRRRLDEGAWVVAEIFMAQYGDDKISKNDFRSISHFVEKIGLDACTEAMEKACCMKTYKSGCFRYFCGICWRIIKEENNNG